MSKGGDIFNVGQAGVVGRNVRVDNSVINQTQTAEKLDLPALSDQLAKLRAEMKREATEPDHDVAVGAVAAAEAAAKKGDEKSVLDHLKNAGQWAMEIGLKVGVPVAIEAIKKASGF